MKTATKRFRSLDQQSDVVAEHAIPDRYRDILSLTSSQPVVAMGSGLSYVAAGFGNDVLSVGMRKFNRLLSFDPDAGLLEVEAGATVGELYEFLYPRKHILPVQPGYPDITVGGCIAANAHGKNQFEAGVFCDHVESMTLFHPEKGELIVSRRTENALFELTAGGMGLTGIILSAKLRLHPLQGAMLKVHRIPVDSLEHCLEEMRAARDSAEMLLSWNDLSRPGSAIGKGYIYAATSVDEVSGDNVVPSHALLDVETRMRLGCINKLTAPIINAVYRAGVDRKPSTEFDGYYDFLYPAASKSIYFKMYGRPGFVECQSLLPEASMNDFLAELRRLMKVHDQPVMLTSMKYFKGRSKFLNYIGDGVSFSIDLPAGEGARKFVAALHEAVSDAGGISNFWKDSLVTDKTVKRQYREYDAFASALAEYDPKRLFRSELSERLGL